MGHYSDAYERDDDELAKDRALRRSKNKIKMEDDLRKYGIIEVILRSKEGYY
jgi:hypothetical protein